MQHEVNERLLSFVSERMRLMAAWFAPLVLMVCCGGCNCCGWGCAAGGGGRGVYDASILDAAADARVDASRCSSDSACDDGIYCTIDGCVDGVCRHGADSNLCPRGEECVRGRGCGSAPRPCDEDADCNDDAACTNDQCGDSGYCRNEPQHDRCGMDEMCLAGPGCVPKRGECTTEEDCTAGRPCDGTWECASEFGCQYQGPINCDDGFECTDDACGDDGACVHAPNDAPCDDGDFCTGSETCDLALGCVPGAPPDCDDGNDCTMDACNSMEEACVYVPGDDDRDGSQDGACGGNDCNDENPAVHPGAAEVCNGEDDDCDGNTDEDLGLTPCGTGACWRTVENCVGGERQTCVPGVPVPEVCNGRDDDCNGDIDDGLGFRSCGFGECLNTVARCVGGMVQVCDPGVPVPEVCNNGLDDDCDGFVDERDFVVKSGEDVRITNAPGGSWSPSSVWTGSEFGIAWWDERDPDSPKIYFVRVSAAGVKIGDDVQISEDVRPQGAQQPALVWNGTGFAVAWQDNRVEWVVDGTTYSMWEIFFARISAVGEVVGSNVRVTRWEERRDIGHANYYNAYPSLVWTGSEYGVAWESSAGSDRIDEIYFARVSSDGVKIGSDVRITNASRYSGQASLVWTGSEFGVVWVDQRDNPDPAIFSDSELYFVRISATGVKIGDDVRVTAASGVSNSPSLAWNWRNSEYGVAWYDTRDGNAEIYFARISSDGILRGSTRVTGDTGDSSSPSLVWTGTEYGIAWSDGRGAMPEFPRDTEIYFTYLTGDGTKIGLDARVTMQNGESAGPSLVWNWRDGEYGVAWYDNRVRPGDGRHERNSEIFFVRFNACRVRP